MPIVEKRVFADEEATAAFAHSLAQLADVRRAHIELHGDLGVGKTTLVRHLLRSLGVSTRVKSPTYTVVESYEARTPARVGRAELLAQKSFQIWHFDFYRMADPREWEEAGFRDLFACEGLKLVEWPDKAKGFAPLADLAIRIEAMDNESRHLTITANTSLGERIIKGLQGVGA